MASQALILIVDDEASIRFTLQETLERDGYLIETAAGGAEALQKIEKTEYDLVLVDLRLQDVDGLQIVAALRKQWPETISIVLTAHASLDSAVEALRQGAHDYLFKPCKTVDLRESIRRGLAHREKQLHQRKLLFNLEQYLSNSLTNLRSTIGGQGVSRPAVTLSDLAAQPQDNGEQQDRFLKRAGLTVDFLRHVITLDGHLLQLSPTEFDLLAYLISEAPRVIPPKELVREVQGYESEQWEAGDIVRFHIYRIRQKIKAATGESDVIRTVRGIGYTIHEDSP